MKINKKCIGEGSFCKVYEAIDSRGRVYAVKVESRVNNNNYLESESQIHFSLYKADVEQKYVVPVYDFISDEKYNFLIMKRLFMSLGDVQKKLNENFDEYSIRNIAKRLIEILKFTHKNNICHCDIKPENIMISQDFQNIYLIDYGLSKYFIKNGKHIPFKTDINNGGTLRYMSVHTNHKIEISRRDDLISLGYVLVYLQKGSLPWQIIPMKNRFTKVAEMKLEIKFEELCKDCVPELIPYLEYCYKLGFEDEPDYDYLINLFNLKE